MTLQKAICIETLFTEIPFEERFALVKEHGFKYVEFWTWKDKDILKIQKLCSENDLKIAGFSGDQDFSLVDPAVEKAYITFAKESIATAKRLGASFLVVHSDALGEGGRVVKPFSKNHLQERTIHMVRILRNLAPWAEKEDLTLVLEALNTHVDHPGYFLSHTEEAVEIVKQVDSSHVKILYDIYHMQIMEGNLIDTIKKYISLIGHIHIADVPGRHEPGTGEINFRNIMCLLEDLGYEGIVGFELYPLRTSFEAIQAIQAL